MRTTTSMTRQREPVWIMTWNGNLFKTRHEKAKTTIIDGENTRKWRRAASNGERETNRTPKHVREKPCLASCRKDGNNAVSDQNRVGCGQVKCDSLPCEGWGSYNMCRTMQIVFLVREWTDFWPLKLEMAAHSFSCAPQNVLFVVLPTLSKGSRSFTDSKAEHINQCVDCSNMQIGFTLCVLTTLGIFSRSVTGYICSHVESLFLVGTSELRKYNGNY